ncbi:MAG: hypothetical protein ACI92Z_003381 [Paracoccaceae bacterium]|jgi:hypothetical protein
MTHSFFHTFGLRSLAAAGVLAASLTSVSAETIDWKMVDDWDISYYPGSSGCQAFAVFDGQTAFFIGFDANDDELSLDVTILDERWSSIMDGEDYPISVKFGDESPWTLGMSGTVVDNYSGLNLMIDISSDEAELFIDEFQRENSMEWSFSGNQLGHYTLRGSRRAFNEAVACQRAYIDTADKKDDPFAGNNSGKSDPFSD